MRNHFRLALVAVAALSATAAHAQVTEYTSQAAFVAALQGGFLNATSFGTTSSATLTISGNGFSTGVTATGGTTYAGGSLFGANVPTDVVTFTMAGTNITAFGGNFFTTNISDATQTDTTVSLTVNLNIGSPFTTTAFTNQFRGFTAPVGARITSVTFQKVSSTTTADRYATANNIFLGARTVASAAAPEPATALFVVAGAVVALARRRRK